MGYVGNDEYSRRVRLRIVSVALPFFSLALVVPLDDPRSTQHPSMDHIPERASPERPLGGHRVREQK